MWDYTKIKLYDLQTKCYANPGDSSIILQQCVFAAGQLVKPEAKINVKVENPLSCLEQTLFQVGQQSS